MWTRAELKERAKACLRKYYWAAFAVSLVFSLVSGIGSPVTQPADSGYQDDYYEEYGNLNVPVSYSVNGVKLGRWISNIRAKRKHPEGSGMVLDEHRIRQLDSIGMDWK